MGVLDIFSYGNPQTKSKTNVVENSPKEAEPDLTPHAEGNAETTTEPLTEQAEQKSEPEGVPAATSPPRTSDAHPATDAAPEAPVNGSVAAEPEAKPSAAAQNRRFSFKKFGYIYEHDERKHELSSIQEHEKKARAADARHKSRVKPVASSADKRAKESALIVRSLIVGPAHGSSPQVTKATAKPQLNKVKSQLMQPKSANKVIAQLRALPVSDEDAASNEKADKSHGHGPIHAVCLAHTDAEEQDLHFAHLSPTVDPAVEAGEAAFLARPAAFSGISIDKLAEKFNEMQVVNLIKSQPADLGLGQPGDGEGILAGAVPTAKTVVEGFEQITPQLMALGFATSKAVFPDHAGVYPPLDRMSVLTYWWGLEVALPPPTLKYLSSAQSVSGTVMSFLSALAVVHDGVREILPFIRYISQYMDFEFNAIKSQDRGDGVVCAATWIMPAAMVPRPWDFPTPPSDSDSSNGTAQAHGVPPKENNKANEPSPSAVVTVPPPLPPVSLPQVIVTAASEQPA